MTARKRDFPMAFVILLTGLAILLLPGSHSPVHLAHASNRTISLVAYYPAWNHTDPVINVTQGDTITISLRIGDGIRHQFWLDFDGDGVSDQSDCSPTTDPCSMQFTSTPPPSVTFTANSIGSYKYYCTIHYLQMVGTLNVLGLTTPGFTITPSPPSLTFQQGTSSSSRLTLTTTNGFSGAVSLSATVSPAGPTTSFRPTSVTISPSSPAISNLTISTASSTASGSYTIVVKGTSGSTTNTTTILVTLTSPPSQDFGITPSQTSLTIAQGSTGTTTITLTSMNGFSGTLTLGGTVSPSSSGPAVSFSPSSVTITSGGSGTSIMTVSAVGGYYSSVANGNYAVNVTATNGSLSHSTTVQVAVGSPSSPPSGASLPLTVLAGSAAVIVAAAGVAVYLVRGRTASK